MVIAYIAGGLGNQMFEYAAARRLAHHRNVELKLDLSVYRTGFDQRPEVLKQFRREVGLFKFAVTAAEATESEIARLRDPYSVPTTMGRIVRRLRRVKPGLLWPVTHVREKHNRFDSAIMELPGDTYLDGFWQSWKYFADIRDLLLKEFALRDPAIIEYNRQYMDRLREKGRPIVSIHVRRGDMAHAYEKLANAKVVDDKELVNYVALWGKTLAMEYVGPAMDLFGPEVEYLVFSDTTKDIQWCRENIKREGIPPDRLHFSEGHEAAQDMALMAACDHNIIANSTYSWWAGWLNQNPAKRVISPSRWTPVDAKVQVPLDDLIPPEWELI